MTDQFRAMCAELTERLEWFIAEDETNENDPGNQYWLTGKQAGIDSVTRARALLNQPVAEGLTDQELLRCGRIATPCYDLKIWERELNMMRAAIAADRARALLAQPVVLNDIGQEWRPCVKLPITVHVRDQRPGETHSSTREGITPLRSDDLIMRGVRGEEYPIGRDLFEQTYELLPTPEATND